MPAHYFFVEDLSVFLANLEAQHYIRTNSGPWVTYSNTLSGSLIKHYSYRVAAVHHRPVQIRVSYDLVRNGHTLHKLVRQLKDLNFRYRQSLSGWKTKREPRKSIR